jgi:hypothetical protein
MIGQLLPNTNEMLQCILAIQILDLNTAVISLATACDAILDSRGEIMMMVYPNAVPVLGVLACMVSSRKPACMNISASFFFHLGVEFSAGTNARCSTPYVLLLW